MNTTISDYNYVLTKMENRAWYTRKGQAGMNALFEVNPDLYNEVTATDIDPFYNDSKIPAFLDFLKTKMV